MGPGGSRPVTRHEREVMAVDRRWLIAWVATFLGTLAAFFVAYAIYKATGPHPQVTVFLRQLKHEVRWLIPGLKRKPNAKPEALRLEPDHLRHAAVDLPRG